MAQYLTEKSLFDACDHAMTLWVSGDQKVPERYRRSDMELLTYFGDRWIEYCKSGTQLVFSNDELIALIHSCQFSKTITLKLTQLRFELFAEYLTQTNLRPTVEYSYSLRTASRWQYGSKFVGPLANSLSDSGDASFTLASSFLFFAVPQLYFFNYSKPIYEVLRERMEMETRLIGAVGAKLGKLHQHHAEVLHSLPRPEFSLSLRQAVADGDWWERRVLELAVSDHWE